MAKKKFIYNTNTLRYEPFKGSKLAFLGRFAVTLILSVVFAAGFIFTYSYLFDSPEEIQLKNENNRLETQLYLYGHKLDSIYSYLGDVQKRDDEIYRVLLGEKPLEPEIRMAGIGGNAYEFSEDDLISQSDLDQAKARVAVQKASLDELTYRALQLEQDWKSRPRITPIRQKDLIRFASGFGNRIHPIYGIMKFHEGIDLTAAKGTPVYAASGGTVMIAADVHDGYGKKVVIDHGNGYKTLYAHLSKISVKPGQKIKLANKIGEVGNTGTSVAPHLHYEVRKNDHPIDPSPYLYSLFTDEEFDRLVALGKQ